MSLWVVAAFFTGLFQCSPISFTWNRIYLWMHLPQPFPIHGSCISQNFVIYLTALSLVSDVGIWLMPMVALFKLKMSARKKFELSLVLSLGAA